MKTANVVTVTVKLERKFKFQGCLLTDRISPGSAWLRFKFECEVRFRFEHWIDEVAEWEGNATTRRGEPVGAGLAPERRGRATAGCRLLLTAFRILELRTP